jgi:hypothetical protein
MTTNLDGGMPQNFKMTGKGQKDNPCWMQFHKIIYKAK